MASNPETKRSKHIDIKIHYIRDCVWSGKLELVKVESKGQEADILTKPLGKVLFGDMRLVREGVLTHT